MTPSRSLFASLVALFVALASAGCGSKDSKIVGLWKIDVEATKAAIKDSLAAKNVPQNLIDLQMQTIAASADAMTFDFKSDKTVQAMGMPATWRLDGDNVMVANHSGGELKLEYRSGKLHFQPEANSGSIVLARQ